MSVLSALAPDVSISPLSLLLCGLALCLVSAVCILLYLRLVVFRRDPSFKGMAPELMYGNLRQFGVTTKKNTLGEALDLHAKKFGPIYQYFLSLYRFVVVTDADAAHAIFGDRQTFDQADTTRNRFTILSPNGLINLIGPAHKRHVHAIGPLFRKHKSAPWVPMMADRTALLTGLWRTHRSNGAVVDAMVDFKRLTLDIFGTLAYATEFGCLSEIAGGRPSELATSTGAVVDWFTTALRLPLPAAITRIYFKLNSEYQRHQKVLRDFVGRMIDEWTALPESERALRTNLLSNMLEALDKPQGLTREEVFDELVLFIFAGFETTSSFLAWFVVWMCREPRVQAKLKKHVRQVLAASDGVLDANTLASMHYLDCVWKEVFRCTPVAQGVVRTTTQPTVLLGHSLPTGTHVHLNILGLHYDPKLWKHDPNQFYPERFVDPALMPEERDTPFVGIDREHHPCALLPFGGGHRACLGQELARLETKTIMAILSRDVTFARAEGYDEKITQKITAMPTQVNVTVSFEDS